MLSSSSDLSQNSFQFKQDDKFSSKRLTREVCMTNFPLEDYHGGPSVAVPFMWESQPGTPKAKLRQDHPLLPPLTPPPSYFYNTTSSETHIKKHSKPSLLQIIFPRRATRKTPTPSSPPLSSYSSSSLSSSSFSVPSSPRTPSNFRGRVRMSSQRLSFDSRVDEEEHEYESPVSTLCFGRGANARSLGCYSSMIKVLRGDFA